MSAKRVVIANGSRLMREALRRVIEKVDRLEVVPGFPGLDDMPGVIERFEPGWVFLSSPRERISGSVLDNYLRRYPLVRFVVISPDHSRIELQSQAKAWEDLTYLSLRELLYILDRDLQHN